MVGLDPWILWELPSMSKRIFETVIKWSWGGGFILIIQMGSQCNHMYPYKEAKGDLTESEGNGMTSAESAHTWSEDVWAFKKKYIYIFIWLCQVLVIMKKECRESVSCSVLSDSLPPYGL